MGIKSALQKVWLELKKKRHNRKVLITFALGLTITGSAVLSHLNKYIKAAEHEIASLSRPEAVSGLKKSAKPAEVRKGLEGKSKKAEEAQSKIKALLSQANGCKERGDFKGYIKNLEALREYVKEVTPFLDNPPWLHDFNFFLQAKESQGGLFMMYLAADEALDQVHDIKTFLEKFQECDSKFEEWISGVLENIDKEILPRVTDSKIREDILSVRGEVEKFFEEIIVGDLFVGDVQDVLQYERFVVEDTLKAVVEKIPGKIKRQERYSRVWLVDFIKDATSISQDAEADIRGVASAKPYGSVRDKLGPVLQDHIKKVKKMVTGARDEGLQRLAKGLGTSVENIKNFNQITLNKISIKIGSFFDSLLKLI